MLPYLFNDEKNSYNKNKRLCIISVVVAYYYCCCFCYVMKGNFTKNQKIAFGMLLFRWYGKYDKRNDDENL